MDQIFLVPERVERSGALQSQVLHGGMNKDEVQDSAQNELTPPNSLRQKTTWIRTVPTEPPVAKPDSIFEGSELPSSGSPRARIKYQLLFGGILLSIVLNFLQVR